MLLDIEKMGKGRCTKKVEFNDWIISFDFLIFCSSNSNVDPMSDHNS